MLKEFIWKSFEKTGNIDYYMFYKEIEEKDRSQKKDESVLGEMQASS